MNTLPSDPVILLSTINMKLRDFYATFEALCEDLDEDPEQIREILGSIDYYYDEVTNQFV